MSQFSKHAVREFLIEISKGNIEKHTRYLNTATNKVIVKNTRENIIVGGGAYLFTEGAETISIVSTSPNDADPGSGWERCFINGVDENFNEIQEIIPLNGTTPVNSVNSYIFVGVVTAFDTEELAKVGSSEVNEGTITGIGNTSAKKFFQVDPFTGAAGLILGVVPANKTLFITNGFFSMLTTGAGDKSNVTFRTFLKVPGLGKTLIREDVLSGNQNTFLNIDFNVPLIVPGRARFWIDITTDQDNSAVSGNLIGFFVED